LTAPPPRVDNAAAVASVRPALRNRKACLFQQAVEGIMVVRASRLSLQAPVLLLWAFLLMFAGALPSAAVAQGIGVTIDMNETDLAMARGAAAKLYENLDTPVGASESWSNPASGARGTATLIARMEPNGVQCRRIQHVISVRGRGDPFIFLFDHCYSDGVWRTYP